MRNLKKILALVLALVMSLSLMATASAADFKDASDINETFDAAVEVLSGLGVFNGYKEDGTFRPQGSITRAETAAIIYRIVTGDVNDDQVGIYADYNIFTDVSSSSWYAGYVNFCANAEYIKGIGNGKFDPQGKVTGYAALAMILRAIGYTANGGFTGSDWAVQTARTAEARKITKNINTGLLGQPASRETVAEILYQAIMVNMVDHNVLNTLNGDQGYTEKTTTLGQQTFGLEKVSGVILANEWANLEIDGDTVLPAGKTEIVITKIATGNDLTVSTLKIGDKLTVDAVAEDDMQGALDAVGLTYDAHIATKRGNLVASLDKSDINVVAYNEGKGVYKAAEHNNMNNSTWNTIADLAKTEGIVLGTANETQYFINYAEWWDENCQSDYRISYAIAKDSLSATNKDLPNVAEREAWQKYINELKNATNNGTIPAPTGSKYEGHYLGERTIKIDLDLNGTTETSVDCWVVAIIPGKTINQIDLDIMKEIFYTADRIGTNGTIAEILQNYAVGEVYVGTTSMKDYSDEMSWKEFCAKYFTIDVNSRKFEQCEIGNSLRVIDNNGDDVAEYVLRIDYNQDKAIGTVKSQPAGYSVAIGNYEGNKLYNPQADEITQGTVFNYTIIDKKLYVWPAPVVTDSITNKNFEKITVTAANGETYNQSGIKNYTQLDENIMLMNNNTQYNMYMDVYGNNIRSYELAQGSKYALLTEMYPTTNFNGNYVKNLGAVAEVKIADADVTEYPVTVNTNGVNTFFSPYIWTWGLRGYFSVNAGQILPVVPGTYMYNANYLQPAVAHLGVNSIYASTALASGLGSNGNNALPAVNTGRTDNQESYRLDTTWNRAVAGMLPYDAPANGIGGTYGVFDYGPEGGAPARFSFTNVATYVDVDGTLVLNTVSKLATDRTNGAQLYRISENITATNGASYEALNGYTRTTANADAYDQLKELANGTEAELLAAFDAVHGITSSTDLQAETWFNKWIGATYRRGNGIYPVYAEDYVQLDLTKADMGQALKATDLVVKPGIRHYHINDNYDKLYNTNSNQYVDATVDTEFYIVLPGNEKSIIYKVGYADLPQIKVEDIRAAYAVAHNVNADKDNKDYWVADVIVIETSSETLNYDSISLTYYNPYEQDGFVRYANTLNNEWKTLQPDYENKAMMGITPKDGNFTGINWGNVSWSTSNPGNYGFWRLYRTDLTAPGQLSVTSAEKILVDFNKYGIYAGQINRIRDLQPSDYLDVTTRYTGCVQTYAIDVDYNEATEVPFYRISETTQLYGNIYTATQMNQNRTLNWSNIKDGDPLIWVYEKTNPSRIAFVVDLGSRTVAEDGFKYDAPVWLRNLYNSILNDKPDAPGATAVTFYGKAATLDKDDVANTADDTQFQLVASATLPYADAVAGTTNGIQVTNGKIVIANATVGTSAITNDGASATTTRSATPAVTYTGTIAGDDGKYYTYTFTQAVALTGKDLTGTGVTAGTLPTLPTGTVGNEYVPIQTLLASYLPVSAGATVKWTIKLNDKNDAVGPTLTATTVNNTASAGSGVTTWGQDGWKQTSSADVKWIAAQVIAENGDVQWYETTGADMPTTTVDLVGVGLSANAGGSPVATGSTVKNGSQLIFTVTGAKQGHFVVAPTPTGDGPVNLTATVSGGNTVSAPYTVDTSKVTSISVTFVEDPNVTLSLSAGATGAGVTVTGAAKRYVADAPVVYTIKVPATYEPEVTALTGVTAANVVVAPIANAAAGTDNYTVTVSNVTGTATVTIGAVLKEIEDNTTGDKDPGTDPGTGTDYKDAYEAAGIDVLPGANNLTKIVSVNYKQLEKFIEDCNKVGNDWFTTLRPDGTGNLLAAGVTFTGAPANAQSAKVWYVDSVDETLGAADDTWNKAASGRAHFDSNGIHLYMSVTNEGNVVTPTPDVGTGPAITDLHPYNMGGTKQKLVYVQYFTGANGTGDAIGEPVLYTMQLQWTNK